ncbi:MAG: type I DNA topoisomerase [Planctomycetota bacterium]|nr:type I DNA topoisomerase [Planctomycetota bacterium]
MSKHLVIVESPAKVRTISRFLGDDYVVEASVGHVLDLPRRNPKGVKSPVPGIDLDDDFKPTYETLQRQKKTLAKLKKAAKQADGIWLATDLDREGEAIAWLLAEAMKADETKLHRVVFNEITKEAILQAFEHPRSIDMSKVNAQQARRILDRIVGYQVSPLLWKKVAGGLSAGRVQSVAVRLIVQRELEIRAHVPDESWTVTANLTLDTDQAATLIPTWTDFMATLDEKGKSPTRKRQNAWLAQHGGIKTELLSVGGEKFSVKCSSEDPQDLSAEIVAAVSAVGLNNVQVTTTEDPDGKGPAKYIRQVTGDMDMDARYAVDSMETKPTTKKPDAPFITSTLQVAASNTFGFTASRTMGVAQKLYEGLSIPGEGHVGLITYMRTDSTAISKEAIVHVREHIDKQFGEAYLPPDPNYYGSSNKSAQEAHEAIRPTYVHLTPEKVAGSLDEDQKKLYALIYNRFLGCQMTKARWNVTTVQLQRCDQDTGAVLKVSGRVLEFDGFYRATGVPTSSDEQTLPDLTEGQQLAPFTIEPRQKFSSPPPRYNEGSLVKKLESEAIGRPSTYASIIKVIQDRQYVDKRGTQFFATDLGEVVTEKLMEGFPELMKYGYTKWMEEQLDSIENGGCVWTEFLHEFYGQFSQELDTAHENMTHAKAETELAPEEYLCPDCGKRTEYRFGRNGRFLSCTGFRVPPVPIDIPCAGCGIESMGVNKGKTARARPFLTCTDCEQKTTYSKLSAEDKERVVTIASAMEDGCKYAAPIDHEGRPINPEITNIACPKCGDPMMKRTGRFGAFLSCVKYPDCGGIVNIDKKKGGLALPKIIPLETDLECNKCDSHLYLRNGARGPWLGCSRYPKCRGRGAWTKLEDDIRKKWEAALENHESENPAPIIKTVEGQVCEAGYQPEELQEDYVKEN